MRRHRADTNQDELVKILRKCGVSVVVTSQLGDGAPDTILGHRGETMLAEIKNIGPCGWKYTPAQKDFRERWCGSPIFTFDSVESVLQWVNRKELR